MNGAETRSRRGEAGRAAAMNSAEQTVTWLITLGVLESPKKTISDPEGFLQASLKDGVVLCRLLERLLPGTIEKVSAPPARPAHAPPADRPGAEGGPGGGRPRAYGGPAPHLAPAAARGAPRRAGAGSPAPAPGGRARARRSPRASFVRGPGRAGGARAARGVGGGIPPGLGAPLCAGPAGTGGRVRGERPGEAGGRGSPARRRRRRSGAT